MKFSENNVENLRKSVEEKVKFAIENIPDLEKLENNFLKGKINFGEVVSKMNLPVVKVDTLIEFRLVLSSLSKLPGLEFLKDKKNIDEYISHENAHANKTEELDAVFDGYEFILFKKRNVYFIKKINTNSIIPEDWDEKKKIETMIKILGAPEEYGGSLSKDDINKRNILIKNNEQ